jgi:N-methylhydantoinase B
MVAALRVLDAVHGALSGALPDSVPAQGYNTTTGFYIAQPQKDGTVKVFLDVMGGGYGAAKDYDGASAVDTPLGSCRNTPVEAIEQASPHLRVVGYKLAESSCGAGKFQGGLGFSRSIMAVEDGVFFNMYSDHFALPPKGLFGGSEAA